MKKFLLSLLCVFGVVALASAETYTYTYKMSDVEGFGNATSEISTWTCGPFTFSTAKGEGNNNPTYNKAGDVRLYAKNTLTVSVSEVNITSISFNISSAGLKRLTDVTPSTGEIAEQGVNPLVWNGEASSVTFTVGEKAVYGTDGETKAGQFDFDQVTITTDGTPGEVEPPVGPETVYNLTALEDFEKGTAFTMGIDLTVVYANGANAYVYDGFSYCMLYKKGGIGLNTGDVIAKGWTGTVDIYSGLLELVPDQALTISGTADLPAPLEVDAEMASMVLQPYNANQYVKLLAVTFAENTPSAKANFNGVMGEGEDAYTVTFRNNYQVEAVTAGTYDVVAFIGVYNGDVQVYPIEYIGNSGQIELPKLDSFNAIYDMENGEEFVINVAVKVLYTKGSYTYVNDGYMNALIYKNGLNLEAGDVIAAGWKASLSIYNGLYEIVPTEELTVAEKGATLPEPMEVEAADVNMFVAAYNQAAYLKLMNVTFAEATPTGGAFKGTMGETEINFYNRFNLASVDADAYNVVGFVAVYNETVQVYVTAFESVSGISGINVDNTPVKYFNLQGIEVSNPQPGQVYIRVQGNNASKVIR